MLKSQLKLIFRKIRRQKLFSFLVILCLSIGMLTAIFVSTWIRSELSFEDHHTKVDRIYRLTVEVNNPENGYNAHFARSWMTWLKNMDDKIAGVEKLARISYRPEGISLIEQQSFKSDIFYTDPELLNIFTFDFIDGDKENALTKPRSIILTKTAAFKYFGDQEALGKEIRLFCKNCMEELSYTVTAIIEDMPSTSHFHFDVLANYADPDKDPGWAYYYILLEENTKPEDVNKAFESFAKEYVPEDVLPILYPHIQNIKDIHLFSHKAREFELNGNMRSLKLFAGFTLFVLFIALFNFQNLQYLGTLKSYKIDQMMRVFGARTESVLIFHLLDSFVFSLLGAIFSLLLYHLFFPVFLNFMGINFSLASTIFLLKVLGILLLVSTLSGVLPYFLSRLFNKFKHAASIKRAWNWKTQSGSGWQMRFARILVVLQFAATIIMIISIIIVTRQVDLMFNSGIGNQDQKIINLRGIPSQIENKYELFKEELLKNPLIYDITCSFEDPADENNDAMSFETSDLSEEMENKVIFVYPCDDNYLSFYDKRIIAGQNFPEFNGNDSLPETYILNESAVKFLGWTTETAIGRKFSLVLDMGQGNIFKGGEIIGVVEDFQMSNMKNLIKPYVFFQKSFWFFSAQIKYDNKRDVEAINYIQKIWEEYFPSYPFDYVFVQDLYSTVYKNETGLQKISILLGILALILSGLGLWGMTGMLYEMKTKEIGIRKVNGASGRQILSWLLKDILLLTMVSSIVAIPLARYLMKEWLSNYAYKINPGIDIFLFAIVGICLVNLLIVMRQAIKVSNANPLSSLRYE
jgi:putative ABC transport system permease protein